ncbi:MAG: patatin-like phospholipase family protein [Chloroflexota bacterium]
MEDTKQLVNRIGISLSGGGVRAAVFHLGILGQLAELGLLEQITTISTVSGGSLVTGLIFTVAGNVWPTNEAFLAHCLPTIRSRLTDTHSVQRDMLTRLAWRPWQLSSRSANQLAESISRCWGIHGLLSELSTSPRWVINATTYETGKNWRFIPQLSMGDYAIGYVQSPQLPLAQAMAASAAVPGLIGAYELPTKSYEWYGFGETGNRSRRRVEQAIPFDVLHLWDGSVYDFLGTEPLFKVGKEPYPPDVDYLIVCDASQPLGVHSGATAPFHQRAHRLVTIATDQVRSLRTRAILSHFRQHPGSGAFLKIGNQSTFALPTEENANDSKVDSTSSLSPQDVEWAANMETTLRSLTPHEFDLLYHHGWEVAGAILRPNFCSLG